MSVVLITDKPAGEQIILAKEEYSFYIKLTIDVVKEIVAMGGEYHFDAEQILLSQGSQQADIWGGGLNLDSGGLETNAMINLQAGKNDSTEILDLEVRRKFLEIAGKVMVDYVK